MRTSRLLSVSFDSESDLTIPLKRLARACHVPIGFEAATEPQTIRNGIGHRVSVEEGTMENVLDALVSARESYIWEETGGVVNVLPRERIDTLGDIVLEGFGLGRLSRDAAIRKLLNTREVRHWITRMRVREKSFATSQLAIGEKQATISLFLTNVSVRVVLNKIMKASNGCFWSFFRYGRDNDFFSLTM